MKETKDNIQQNIENVPDDITTTTLSESGVESKTVSKSDVLAKSLADDVRILTPGRMVLRRFFRSKLSVAGLTILLVIFAFIFIGPLFAPWGEQEIDRTQVTTYSYSTIEVTDAEGNKYTVYELTEFVSDINKLAQPFSRAGEQYDNRMHVLGTDENGRDIFTRLMYGGQKSVSLSFFTVFLYVALGVVLGSIAGYVGKWADQIIMRLVDIINCIPSLPIMLILSAILESLSIPQASRIYYLMAILTLLNWTGIARLVRGQILFLREQEYMVAADALGLSAPRKVFKHLIPNIIPQLIVVMTLGLGSMVLYEATLGYLGLGFPLEIASWGKMVNSATTPDILKNYAFVWMPSGICIILVVLGFNFMGDGLRDALDPKMKR